MSKPTQEFVADEDNSTWEPEVAEPRECPLPGCPRNAGPSGVCIEHEVKDDPIDEGAEDERHYEQGL